MKRVFLVKRVFLLTTMAMMTSVAARPPAVSAEQGVIGGVDLGVAAPIDQLKHRAQVGGSASPFLGYMFTDNLGLMGQIQGLGMPYKNRPGTTDKDVGVLGGLAGPRLALPLGSKVELYGTWEGGVFTGLTAHTPISRTSWGYSTGAGINIRLTDQLLLGGFGRYNWLDQRVVLDPGYRFGVPSAVAQVPQHDVQYVTAGLSLTYNLAPSPPPPPPPAVAQAPVTRAAPPPAAKRKIVLRGVNFDFDKSTIRKDARPVLDEAIATLKQEKGIAVIAEGHTDSKGSDDYNMKLSLRRANAVRDYLVAGGITTDRIKMEGFGESRPVATNDTDDGRAQNRRVELRIHE